MRTLLDMAHIRKEVSDFFKSAEVVIALSADPAIPGHPNDKVLLVSAPDGYRALFAIGELGVLMILSGLPIYPRPRRRRRGLLEDFATDQVAATPGTNAWGGRRTSSLCEKGPF